MSNELFINQQVFLVDVPSRRGTIRRTRQDIGECAYLVKWNDGSRGWVRRYAIEPVEDEEIWDIFDLLAEKKFGELNDLRRYLTFILLGGRLANIVYSLDATNTEFMPYQFIPVLTLLESPSKGILIADEVGLGKTIEAGLIWTELRARFHSRRIVVICPAILRDKWIMELHEKFGIDARVLDAEKLVQELKKDKNNIPDGQACVCSLQGLRPSKNWRLTENQNSQFELASLLDKHKGSEPLIDLLVIDEAHYLRNPQTQNAELGNLMREVSEFNVLLSATPINNKSKDLHQLLHLIDPDSFYLETMNPEQSIFSEILDANEPLVAARELAISDNSTSNQVREKLEQAQKHPLLEKSRQLEELLTKDLGTEYLQDPAKRIELASRIDRINLLRHTFSRTRKIEIQEFKVLREATSHFVDLFGQEREFYNRVTQAVRNYAHIHGHSDGFLLCVPQRQMSSCMFAAARSWKNRALGIDQNSDTEVLLYEDQGSHEDTNSQEVGPLVKFVAEETLRDFDVDSLRYTDTKFNKFKFIVDEYLSQHPKEKLIVFAFFKATLNYLHERLSELNYSSLVLHGDVSENKQSVIEKFRESENISVLLTSEVASEGVDLQFCSLLINYDLPWNPMKIEQRIGRIDRIGQTKDKIQIWNMGYSDTIDERIYQLLLEKLEIFERALGGLEAILGQEISELTSDLLSHELTPEQEKNRIQQTYKAVLNKERTQQKLDANAGALIAHGDYILQKIKSAHEFKRVITGHDLKDFVKDYLDRHVNGFDFKEIDDSNTLIVSMTFPWDFANKFRNFIKSERLSGSSELTASRPVICQFQSKFERINSRIELINQFHPLIHFIRVDLKNKLKESSTEFYPLIACTVSRSAIGYIQPGIYIFATKRWTFSGLRTEEVLQTRACLIENIEDLLSSEQSWNLVNASKSKGMNWLAVSNLSDTEFDSINRAFNACDKQLLVDYESAKINWDNENADRISLQLISVERHRKRLLTNKHAELKKYKEENREHREPLIRMTEGRIKELERKFGLHIESLKSRGRAISTPPEDICYGVVQVT